MFSITWKRLRLNMNLEVFFMSKNNLQSTIERLMNVCTIVNSVSCALEERGNMRYSHTLGFAKDELLRQVDLIDDIVTSLLRKGVEA